MLMDDLLCARHPVPSMSLMVSLLSCQTAVGEVGALFRLSLWQGYACSPDASHVKVPVALAVTALD